MKALTNMVDDVKVILSNLSADDFNCDAYKEKGEVERHLNMWKDRMVISIKKDNFNLSDIIETIDELFAYLKEHKFKKVSFCDDGNYWTLDNFLMNIKSVASRDCIMSNLTIILHK